MLGVRSSHSAIAQRAILPKAKQEIAAGKAVPMDYVRAAMKSATLPPFRQRMGWVWEVVARLLLRVAVKSPHRFLQLLHSYCHGCDRSVRESQEDEPDNRHLHRTK